MSATKRCLRTFCRPVHLHEIKRHRRVDPARDVLAAVALDQRDVVLALQGGVGGDAAPAVQNVRDPARQSRASSSLARYGEPFLAHAGVLGMTVMAWWRRLADVERFGAWNPIFEVLRPPIDDQPNNTTSLVYTSSVHATGAWLV